MRPHLIFLLALVGCSGDDGDDTPVDAATTTGPTTTDTGPEPIDTEVTGEPWLQRNHQGSVVVRRQLESALGRSETQLYGLFVDDMQGISTGLWCMDRGVCLDDSLSFNRESDIRGIFRRGQSDYDWVGEAVYIGNDPRTWEFLPFIADETANFGVYRRSIKSFSSDDMPPYRVTFGGEWDEVEIDDAVEVPLLPRLLSPEASTTLPLAREVTLAWEWPPEDVRERGPGKLFLRVSSNQVDRMIPLPDDGPYTLDLSDWGLNPSSALDLYFGRWLRSSHTTEGNNELTVWSVAEQPLTTERCSGAPNVFAGMGEGQVPGPTGIVLEVDQVSVGFRGVVDLGEVYDYRFVNSEGEPETASAELLFDLYDVQGNRCSLVYDASLAESRAPFPSDSGALVQQAFQLQPSPANLLMRCDNRLLAVDATGGSDPLVVTVQPGVVETGTATLNQRSEARRETPATAQGQHRIDRVYIGLDGVNIVQGQEVDVSAQPTAPPVPASAQRLAMLLVRGNEVVEQVDERVYTERMPADAPVVSVRALIETREWSFGFGESLRHVAEPSVPPGQVWGFFADNPDGEVGQGIEIGAGSATHLTNCFEVGPGAGPVPYASGAPITSGLYEMRGYTSFGFEFPEPTGFTGQTGDTGSTTGDTGP